jgi:hypothetical protein
MVNVGFAAAEAATPTTPLGSNAAELTNETNEQSDFANYERGGR